MGSRGEALGTPIKEDPPKEDAPNKETPMSEKANSTRGEVVDTSSEVSLSDNSS